MAKFYPPQKFWKFEVGSWACSSISLDASKAMTQKRLWDLLRSEGWHGKSKNYRFHFNEVGDLIIESNLYFGEEVQNWRVAEVCKLIIQEGAKP